MMYFDINMADQAGKSTRQANIDGRARSDRSKGKTTYDEVVKSGMGHKVNKLQVFQYALFFSGYRV